jgi:hypothetical protein
MSKREKVFCTKCKHSKHEERYSMVYVCKLTNIITDRPEYQMTEHEECAKINANNHCNDYEPSFLTSFLQKFKKSKKPDVEETRFDMMDI